MEHFLSRGIYHMDSSEKPVRVNLLDLSKFEDLDISGSEKPQPKETEKERTGAAPETLEKMREELGAIGGAGHFFEDDREIYKGGTRDEMNEMKVRKVLKLLALGERKINLKEWEFCIFQQKR